MLNAVCKARQSGCQPLTITILRVMQLTAIFFLGICLHVTASGLSQTVTFSGRDVPLEKVFAAVKKQTGYQVVYDKQNIRGARGVSLSAIQIPLNDFLVLALKDQPYRFSIEQNTIFIKKQEIGVDLKSTPSLSPSLPPPPITVRGRIVNEKGEPVVASIFIKESNRGTFSNSNGVFQLNDVEENATLIITSANTEMTIIKVDGNGLMKITVKSLITDLNEVVVNKGYYSEKKRLSTGNVSTVTSKDIERQPVTSPLMALQGRVPGLDITPSSGVAGGAVTVQIRGRNSITNINAYPLYIVDGIPVDATPLESFNASVVGPAGFDPLSTINPANIASIEILKDADATAIYGSRGANGVILITTKKGNLSSNTNVDLSMYKGIGKVPHFIDMLNTQQYVSMRKEAYSNAGQLIGGSGARDLLLWDTTRYTDWQKELLGGSADITDVQANVSTGTTQTSFRFGMGYHKEGMAVPGDFGYRRSTAHFNLHHQSLNQKFQASLSMNYGIEVNNLFKGSLIDEALSLSPNAPALYKEAGQLNWENSSWTNPLVQLEKTARSKANNIIINSKLGYELLSGLTASVSFGYTNIYQNTVGRDVPLSSIDPALIDNSTTATGSFTLNQRNSWIVEPQLNFNKTINNHTLNIVAGGTIQEAQSANQVVEAFGYSSDVLLGSLQGASEINYLTDNTSEYKYMAAYGRIGYNFKEKYLLNLTGRRDGSSRFGPGKRWGNFGAVGAGWVFSEERFASGISFISFGKLRASYGLTGSDQVGNYKYISAYIFMPYQYQGGVSLAPNGLANSDYAWETNNKLEAAIELGLLRGRINIEADWYRNRCSNQLINLPLPGATGFNIVTDNLDATVENRGWEFILSTENIKQKNFKWNSSFNITIPRNKLISFPGLEQSSYGSFYVIGKSLNIFPLFRYKGVNPISGLYEVEDADGNGMLDTDDFVSDTEVGRQFYGGLNNSFQYKGLELSFLFQFSQQVSLGYGFPSAGLGRKNIPVAVFDNHWRKEGDIAKYQKFSSRFIDIFDTQSQANASEARFEKNSFFRLKTLSLFYSLPELLLKKIPLKALRIYVQGQNLFTATNFNLLDPETGSFLPPLRMLTAGVEIKL